MLVISVTNTLQSSEQSTLTKHIHSEHEGIKYDYQATRQDSLKVHIESIHEGVKHACKQCDFQATTHSHLTRHKKKKHL